MSSVGPLAQGGLAKAFGFAVGLGRVRASAAVFEAHLQASLVKVMGPIAAAIVGKQDAHANAVKQINSSALRRKAIVVSAFDRAGSG